MTYTSEIEKLEKRWAENPKGRNFAPLADAYRKAGELDRALELCKSGLERHPDYVSAHIVYGRCFLDLKNDTTATQVFRKVLELDPENVLGLKLLAEIAQRGGRFDEAAEWLTRLLAVDPMNGDAAEALARAKGKAAQTPSKPAPARAAPAPATLAPAAPAPRPVRAPAAVVAQRPAPAVPGAEPPARRPAMTAPMPQPEFVVEHPPEQPVSPLLSAAQPSGDIETFDGTLDINVVAHDTAKAEGLEVQEEVQLNPRDLAVEGLATTSYESGAFAASVDVPPEPEPDLPTVDLPLIMPDDMAPPRSSSAALSTPAWPAPPSPPPPPPPPPPPLPPPPRPVPTPPPAAAATPAAVLLSDDDGAADTAALSRAAPVVTETMAELYLKQGHQEDALRVYQALLAQRPGDAHLLARVDTLSRRANRMRVGGSGESVPTFLRRILAARPRPQTVPPESAASAASPLERAFAVVPPESEPRPEIDAPGGATRGADDTISLDQVFGDEGARGSPPAAEPSPAAAPPTPPAARTGGFSFDQFFGASGAPARDAAPAGGDPHGPAGPSGLKAQPAREDEGELDQFQAWLKGLKS